LQELFITHELDRRPRRPPEYQVENRDLVALARALAQAPDSILQRVTEVARDLYHAATAGSSLIKQHEGQAVLGFSESNRETSGGKRIYHSRRPKTNSHVTRGNKRK
jgi:hypothetical protein